MRNVEQFFLPQVVKIRRRSVRNLGIRRILQRSRNEYLWLLRRLLFSVFNSLYIYLLLLHCFLYPILLFFFLELLCYYCCYRVVDDPIIYLLVISFL